jgi:hypothetical protein
VHIAASDCRQMIQVISTNYIGRCQLSISHCFSLYNKGPFEQLRLGDKLKVIKLVVTSSINGNI